MEIEPEPELTLQPWTRIISHDELVAEVKGIYEGLVKVEAKCVEIDERMIRRRKDLSELEPLHNHQWNSLIDLHKQLLHEHHVFFLVSQHPSASSRLLKELPRSRLQRFKKGISGYVNGKRIAAFPDTGSAQNVVSAAFVKEHGLHVRDSEEAFKLGNSKIIKSIGKVTKVPTRHFIKDVTNLN